MKKRTILIWGSLIFIGIIIFLISYVKATTEGPNSPSNYQNLNNVGGQSWGASISNILASDDNWASRLLSANQHTYYAVGYNYSFSLPSGAIINGIVVEVERHKSGGTSSASDYRVFLRKSDGTLSSLDHSSGTAWPTSDAYASYGSSSDLWNEVWTASDINSDNFGAAIAAQTSITGSGTTVYIDHIRITVYYTDPCAYTSGNWNLNCSANCSVTSDMNLNNNNLTLTGDGTFSTNATISNIDKLTKYSANCKIIIYSGGQLS